VSFPRRLAPLVLLVLIAAVLAAGCGAERSEEPVALQVALDWFPNPDHVALYYALDRGYFDREGLAVRLRTPSDPAAGLKLVATGRFDLAVYYEGDMFFAAEQGLPVVAVGALVPTPLNALIALGDSNVQGPESIAGATIGVAGLPFDDAILATMRSQQGLGSGDVRSVNVGFDLVPALLSRKVDAIIGGYRNIEGIQVELESGAAPIIVPLEELGVPTYDELVLVANRDRLATDPAYADAVRRFLAATVRSAAGARDDEAGAIAIMERETEYEPKQVEAMVRATIGLVGDLTGCLDLARWRTFGRWLSANGLLKEPVDPGRIATNAYLPGCPPPP